MNRRSWIGALGVTALLMTGCAATAAASQEALQQERSHTMPDGTVMPGTEHESDPGPSPAAQMICAGQVVTAVTRLLAAEGDLTSSSAWQAPMFTCTFELDGAPLVLSVHDTPDAAVGSAHFEDLLRSTEGAREIEGMLGLGLPSFSTEDGVVGFLRDGKTLVVDATGLPSELGPQGTKSRHDIAYAVASAVLVCWVHHS